MTYWCYNCDIAITDESAVWKPNIHKDEVEGSHILACPDCGDELSDSRNCDECGTDFPEDTDELYLYGGGLYCDDCLVYKIACDTLNNAEWHTMQIYNRLTDKNLASDRVWSMFDTIARKEGKE